MTLVGKSKIEERLDFLIKTERETLKKQISDARELGDLKENAEYHSAKEKQARVEGEIMELQGALAAANVVDVSAIENDRIVFGATVKLLDVEEDKTITYQIVGKHEAGEDGKISFNSPLGKALIGNEEGDTILFKAPKGEIEYEIESVEYI